MTGFTPNRSYPYPQNSDPADVPFYLQALAEAVCADMTTLSGNLRQRDLVKVSARSAVPQLFPADQVTAATYDFVDIDTDGAAVRLTQQPTRITPTRAGIYVVVGTIVIPANQSNLHDLSIRQSGTTFLDRQLFTNNFGLSSFQQIGVSSLATSVNGTTDYFEMTFEPDGILDDYNITIKTLSSFLVIPF